MQGSSWALFGFAAGVALAAIAARQMLRRHARRVRLAERRARNAERMAEIGAMTGGLAHEIKNPLSTIGLNAQLLQEAISELDIAVEERSRLQSRTQALRRETDRLAGILGDFLQYAGQVHLDRRTADLNAVVQELADFFLPEAERHGVQLAVEPAESASEATAVIDVKLVKQALLNLMLNATQAMAAARNRADGSSEPSRLILNIDPAKDTDGRRVVRVHVRDNGPGIPSETLAKIFNPYFTTRSGGSGLGLPTSRRLIEEHGGRIDVQSVLGQGSTFTVVLPLQPPDQDPPVARSAP